jgi:hypothetical protein
MSLFLNKVKLLNHIINSKDIEVANIDSVISEVELLKIEEEIIQKQIEYWKEKSLHKTTILIWLDRGVCGLTQQPLLKKALDEDHNNVVICLLTGTPNNSILDDYLNTFLNSILYIPKPNHLNKLEFIDVIVGLDYWDCDSMVQLPRFIPRIGIPHGLDISISQMLEWYGAGVFYDYVFYHGLIEDNYREINKFSKLLPPDLLQHDSKEVKVVKIGSPKVNALTKMLNPKSQDIMYLLSDLDYESAKGLQILDQTLTSISSAFPNNNLVIRPFPNQVKEVKGLIPNSLKLKNVRFSLSKSYIKDFSNTKVLIYHRGSSAIVYYEATGIKAIKYNPSGKKEEKGSFFISSITQDSLLKKIKLILDEPQRKTSAGNKRDKGSLREFSQTIFKIVKKEPIHPYLSINLIDPGHDLTPQTNEAFILKLVGKQIYSPIIAAALRCKILNNQLLDRYQVLCCLRHLPMNSNFLEYDPWYKIIEIICENNLLETPKSSCAVDFSLHQQILKLSVFVILGYLKYSAINHSRRKKIQTLKLLLKLNFHNLDSENFIIKSKTLFSLDHSFNENLNQLSLFLNSLPNCNCFKNEDFIHNLSNNIEYFTNNIEFEEWIKSDFLFTLLQVLLLCAKDKSDFELTEISDQILKIPLEYYDVSSWNYIGRVSLLKRPNIR